MKKLFALLLLLALVLTLTGCPPQNYTPTNPSPSNPPSATREELKVHFIDVGQADCILLESCGEFALIDGGNVEDSSLVVSYLQKQGVEELEAVFCSHAERMIFERRKGEARISRLIAFWRSFNRSFFVSVKYFLCGSLLLNACASASEESNA